MTPSPIQSANESPALILAGPTGIGKTALAIELARRLGGEIVSADSMQVYRGMEIGTAQPTAAERARARFHLCGIVEPTDRFDVRRYLELGDAAHAEARERNRLPIHVGGTGMYLRALRFGLFDQHAGDPEARRGLEAELIREGAAAMHARLAAAAPAEAARIAPTDPVRIVRALEVLAVTGRPLGELHTQWATPRPRFPHLLVVLHAGRETRMTRIARRTRKMLAEGWIDEVRALLARGIPPDAHCFKALGYRTIARNLASREAIDLEGLTREIVAETNQFARRQMTWLRREAPAIWLSANGVGHGELALIAEKLLAMVKMSHL